MPRVRDRCAWTFASNSESTDAFCVAAIGPSGRRLPYPIELVAMKTLMDGITRRRFLGSAALAAAAGTASAAGRVSKLRFGFTTYQWGADWEIPTLIANCAKAKAFGV